MSSFTERTVQRALGETGRIQPRIAPSTAPDPWSTPVASSLELELAEEVEATATPPARDTIDGGPVKPATPAAPRSATERPAVPQPTVEPSPEPRLAAPALPQGSVEASMRSRLAASAVPSFRARELDIIAGLLAPTPSLPRSVRSETPEPIDEQVTVASDATRGSAATPALVPGAGAAVHEFDEPPTLRAASTSQPRAIAARSRGAASASMPPQGSPEMRAGVAELDPAPWGSSRSLEAVPTHRSRRRGAEDGAPIVRVQIGRVEVRAAVPPARPAARAARPDAFVSLQQYLHKRGAS